MTILSSLTTSYDNNNIFAKILRGEIPSHRLYEDEKTFALMDIMPRCDGHCLVVPKTPCRNILDATPNTLSAVMATTQLIGHAVMKAFNADGLTIEQYNEPAGGQTIFHLHIHILPRHNGIALHPHIGKMADNKLLSDQANLIRKALASL